jgi:hypothetical protein
VFDSGNVRGFAISLPSAGSWGIAVGGQEGYLATNGADPTFEVGQGGMFFAEAHFIAGEPPFWTRTPESSGGLSGGTIAGIVIASLVVVAAVVGVVVLLYTGRLKLPFGSKLSDAALMKDAAYTTNEFMGAQDLL